MVHILHELRIRLDLSFSHSCLPFALFRVVEYTSWVSFSHRFLLGGLNVVVVGVDGEVGCGYITASVWQDSGLVLLSSCVDWANRMSSLLLLSLKSEAALEVLVLKSAATRRVRNSIQLDWLATGGTLHFFSEPSTEAHQMEHMTAAELLSRLDVAKANAALVGGGALLGGGVHVLQLP